MVAPTATVAKKKMRQSTIGTAMACLHRLNWVLDPSVPYYAGMNRSIGTGYHAGLAQAYEMRMAGETWASVLANKGDCLHVAQLALTADIEQAGENFDWRIQPATSRQPEKKLTLEEAKWLVHNLVEKYLDNGWYWPERYQPVGVEKSFELELSGVEGWVRTGTIDLALLDQETGWTNLVDHKTAKKRWPANKGTASSTPQAGWYVAAWKELSDAEHVTFDYDIQTLTHEFQRVPAHRSDEQAALAVEQGRILARLIDQGGPYPPSPDSFLCSEAYCDFWEKHCAFGKALHDR